MKDLIQYGDAFITEVFMDDENPNIVWKVTAVVDLDEEASEVGDPYETALLGIEDENGKSVDLFGIAGETVVIDGMLLDRKGRLKWQEEFRSMARNQFFARNERAKNELEDETILQSVGLDRCEEMELLMLENR